MLNRSSAPTAWIPRRWPQRSRIRRCGFEGRRTAFTAGNWSETAKGDSLMATAPTVRCGIAIPQDYINGPIDIPSLQTFLSRAEAFGYESAWVQEQIVGTVPTLEPVTLLSYAAAL